MTRPTFTIETFDSSTVSDWDLIQVFHRSVHGIADVIYSPQQKSAWAPDGIQLSEWKQRLAQHTVWVARELSNHECMGFIELDANADIECLYVCPRVQKKGVATRLLSTAYEYVTSLDIEKDQWQVQASDAAYDFFLRHGFLPTQRNALERYGVMLHNTTMQKVLSRRA